MAVVSYRLAVAAVAVEEEHLPVAAAAAAAEEVSCRLAAEAVAAVARPVGRGLHSSTFRLNVSALGGIRGTFRGS